MNERGPPSNFRRNFNPNPNLNPSAFPFGVPPPAPIPNFLPNSQVPNPHNNHYNPSQNPNFNHYNDNNPARYPNPNQYITPEAKRPKFESREVNRPFPFLDALGYDSSLMNPGLVADLIINCLQTNSDEQINQKIQLAKARGLFLPNQTNHQFTNLGLNREGSFPENNGLNGGITSISHQLPTEDPFDSIKKEEVEQEKGVLEFGQPSNLKKEEEEKKQECTAYNSVPTEPVVQPIATVSEPTTPNLLLEYEELRVDACTRIAQSQGVYVYNDQSNTTHHLVWYQLLARLAAMEDTQATEPTDDKFQMKERLVQLMFDKPTIRSALLHLIGSSQQAKLELALTWVYEEFHTNSNLAYTCIVEQVFLKLVEDLPAKWKPSIAPQVALYQPTANLIQFLVQLPHLPFEDLLPHIEHICHLPFRQSVGVSILSELVDQRINLREVGLQRMLLYSTDDDRKLRTPAILTVKKWFLDPTHPFQKEATDYAKKCLDQLAQLEVHLKSEEEVLRPASVQPNSTAKEVEGAAVMKPFHQVSKEVSAQLDLYLGLVTVNSGLLEAVFAIYAKSQPIVRQAIEKEFILLVKHLQMGCTSLIALVGSFPEGAEDLAFRAVAVLTPQDRDQADEIKPLLESVKAGYLAKRIPIRFVTQLVPLYPLDDLKAFLKLALRGLLFKLEDKGGNPVGESEVQKLQLIQSQSEAYLTMLCTPWGRPKPPPQPTPLELLRMQSLPPPSPQLPIPPPPTIQPEELILMLHSTQLEKLLPNAIKAIQFCLTNSRLFPSETIVNCLLKMADYPKLPRLIMRTAIEFVKTRKIQPQIQPQITNPTIKVLVDFLRKLVTKTVWNSPDVWRGFLLMVTMVGSAAHGPLLQLPYEQLKEVMESNPEINNSLTARVKQLLHQRPELKSRLKHLLPLFKGVD